jgi:hypothetical protein
MSLPIEVRVVELPDTEVALSDAQLSLFLHDICAAKAEEFRWLGYAAIRAVDVWLCLQERYAKDGLPTLHILVEDIISLQVTEYMNWTTLSLYK